MSGRVRCISKFIEDLARPHVAQRDLSAQYREAAKDAAREREAQAWTAGIPDGAFTAAAQRSECATNNAALKTSSAPA